MWERACSRRGRVSRCKCRLKDRIREQARSHMWIAFQIIYSGVFTATGLAPRLAFRP